MAKNTNLTKAKEAKNDEFYTRLEDIETEISSHPDYVRQFKDKVVFCNCDDPEQSSFYEFFRLHFNQLGLKQLITTHYNKDGSPSYKLEWSGEKLGDDTVNMIKTPLQGDGDFRSDECIELLKEADIVVTNPPFSIAREDFIPLLFEHNKKFIIVGDLNWVTYKTIFPLLQHDSMWFGYSNIKEFRTPEGTLQKFGNKLWFTNFETDKRHDIFPLTKLYNGNESRYPKYDNYDAIEVSKVSDIPKDYFDTMGVPITFLSDYNPDQFEIIGISMANSPLMTKHYGDYIGYKQNGEKTGRTGSTFGACPVLVKNDHKTVYYEKDGIQVQATYCRIFIRRKKAS